MQTKLLTIFLIKKRREKRRPLLSKAYFFYFCVFFCFIVIIFEFVLSICIQTKTIASLCLQAKLRKFSELLVHSTSHNLWLPRFV